MQTRRTLSRCMHVVRCVSPLRCVRRWDLFATVDLPIASALNVRVAFVVLRRVRRIRVNDGLPIKIRPSRSCCAPTAVAIRRRRVKCHSDAYAAHELSAWHPAGDQPSTWSRVPTSPSLPCPPCAGGAAARMQHTAQQYQYSYSGVDGAAAWILRSGSRCGVGAATADRLEANVLARHCKLPR